MNELTAVLAAMAAVFGGLFNVMKIVDTKNAIRDRVLDMHDGRLLTQEQKNVLLSNDFRPMAVGLQFFLFVFAVGFLGLPFLVEGKVHWLTWLFCWSAAALCVFAMGVDIWASRDEVKRMRDAISKTTRSSQPMS